MTFMLCVMNTDTEISPVGGQWANKHKMNNKIPRIIIIISTHSDMYHYEPGELTSHWCYGVSGKMMSEESTLYIHIPFTPTLLVVTRFLISCELDPGRFTKRTPSPPSIPACEQPV